MNIKNGINRIWCISVFMEMNRLQLIVFDALLSNVLITFHLNEYLFFCIFNFTRLFVCVCVCVFMRLKRVKVIV